jgi:diketogulonate reductase-like aldo/keto reductase
MAVNVPFKLLPSGAKIPAVGFGVYLSEPGAETYDAVSAALKLGYRHIDTAEAYKNETDVGRAVRDSGIPREQVFVTSKIFLQNWGYDKAIAAVRASNERLGLGYIDLYLLHAPGDSATRADTWRALEDLQAEGLLKDIGVSNFGEAHFKKLAETFRVKPAVNQIEVHPWLTRPELIKFFESEGVLIQAYSPLARGLRMSDPTVLRIGDKVGASVAQVMIAYSLAKGWVPLPKSVKEERIRSNLESVNVTLSAEDVAELDALNEDWITMPTWDPVKDHAV